MKNSHTHNLCGHDGAVSAISLCGKELVLDTKQATVKRAASQILPRSPKELAPQVDFFLVLACGFQYRPPVLRRPKGPGAGPFGVARSVLSLVFPSISTWGADAVVVEVVVRLAEGKSFSSCSHV